MTPPHKLLERQRAKYDRRDGRHSWSYRKVERKLIPILGDYTPNSETIRRYHQIAAPDPIVVAALCEVYDLVLEDVDPFSYAVMRLVRDKIDSWCGIRTIILDAVPDQAKTHSPCDSPGWVGMPTLWDDQELFEPREVVNEYQDESESIGLLAKAS